MDGCAHCSALHNSQATETPRCPATDEWVKKMSCLYTMEFYSPTKKNEILLFTGKQTE
jgi:hypothetical protein